MSMEPASRLHDDCHAELHVSLDRSNESVPRASTRCDGGVGGNCLLARYYPVTRRQTSLYNDSVAVAVYPQEKVRARARPRAPKS